jgi:hypothetical protein
MTGSIEGMRREYDSRGVTIGYGVRFPSQAAVTRRMVRQVAVARLGRRVRVRAGEGA